MTPTKKSGWTLQLAGDTSDLRDLAFAHPARPLCVFERDGSFYLEADELDLQTNSIAAKDRGLELLRTMRGIARIRQGNPNSIRIDYVIERNPDGSWGSPTANVEFRIDMQFSMYWNVAGNGPTTSERYRRLADQDSRVKEALRDFAGDPLDFPRLRRVYETIWTEFGQKQKDAQRQIAGIGWAKLEDLKTFAGTVNTSKTEAAHSNFSKYGVAANPMTLEAAREFLRKLLERWVASKL